MHNPTLTQKYTADPGVMVYGDRVYVYGTNDAIAHGFVPSGTNGYTHIQSLNMMSSADLVNWEDHGSIPVAGAQGAARWAGLSWAPHACHKKISGKEKFFLYFANGIDGVGVLTSDSPTGPFTDPLGKPLINRNVPTCKDITWLFDPACLVDDDGQGYLYFGGGIPSGQEANAKTIRVVKLGEDMISLAGDPVLIEAPWVFEDSGINKIGNTYYYSYCTTWSGSPYGNAFIAYMTSSNPMGPFTYVDTCLKNPLDFFGTFGNNHHTIVEFKDQFYIFYHTEWLNKQVFGEQFGFRTTNVDYLPFDGKNFGDGKGTLEGVKQLIEVNPYETQNAAMMAWEFGIATNGLGHTTVSYDKGDYSGVSGVAFSKGAKTITITAASEKGANIHVAIDNENGEEIAKIAVKATGSNNKFETFTAEVKGVNGTKNLFFVASDFVIIDTWKFDA